MKTVIAVALCGIVLAQAAAAHAGVNINVGLYGGAPVVATPPAVVYGPPPRPVPRVAPRFVYSPELGYYVSAAPYDMAYVGQSYYLYRDGGWYTSSSYAGPWTFARGRMLPMELRRHSYRDFSYYRDRACHDRMERREARWHDRDHDRWEHRPGRW